MDRRTGAHHPVDKTTGSSSTASLQRAMDLILRYRRPLVAVWFAYTCYAALSPNNDWVWFAWGSDLLFGRHHPSPAIHLSAAAPGGLHVFANYPFLQMGPLSLLSSQVLRHLGPYDGQYAATAFVGLIGFGCYLALDRFATRATDAMPRRAALTSLIVGLAVAPAWGQLAGAWSHLDDALALSLGIAAFEAARRNRPVAVGLLLGLAVASKMWALPFLALCVVPAARRDKIRAGAVAGAVGALAWVPFYVADPNTSRLGKFGLTESYGSALHVFGIDHVSSPSALRLTQFAIGLLLALLMVRLGRPAGVLIVAMASRLAIEPMTFTYYTAGLLLAAALFDCCGWRRPMPVMSAIALGYMVAFSNYVTDPYERAWVRALSTIGCVIVAVTAAVMMSRRKRRDQPVTSTAVLAVAA